MDANNMNWIAGASGGGGKDGGGSRLAVEDSDTLQSRAYVALLDLLGEGQIGGLVAGSSGTEASKGQSIFLSDTPIFNPDGSANFTGVSWLQRTGTQDQAPITGFGDVNTPYSVGVKVRQDSAYTFSVSNSNVDQVRVIVTLPSLSSQDVATGDIHGSTVQYKFAISSDGGPYVDASTATQVWGDGGLIAGYGAQRTDTGIGIGFYAWASASANVNDSGDYWYSNAGSSVVVQPQYYDGTTWRDYGGQVTMTIPSGLLNTTEPTKTFFSCETAARVRLNVVSIGIGVTLNVGTPKILTYSSNIVITGKCRSRYQRAHLLTLPKPASRWNIRMTRVTADSTSSALANETYIDSYVEIVNTKMSYPNSALIGLTVDSSQFSSIPTRSYLVDGLYIKVPKNYDPVTRAYATSGAGTSNGGWDGTFKMAVSNNPAWILYDLLTTNRYGLGQYLAENPSSPLIDVAKLYSIGKYCDGMVSDGYGGMEPRFVVNTVIQQQVEAYKLIADLCSAFRGMSYWNGGIACFTQDSPTTPSMVFSQANVIDGVFNYTGSARKDRHSVALITWNDPSENFKQKIEYVEDATLISKFGVRKTEMVAFGCTSRGQANRVGRWILYTEQYESDLISFKVGIDAALVLPGDVIKIHDQFRAGKRMAGRLTACTATSATLDAPITLAATGAILSIRMPDGTFKDISVAEGAGTTQTLTWAVPLTTPPVSNAVFVVAEASLQPMLARVIGISQESNSHNEFTITALEHNPNKFALIESGIKFDTPPTSILNLNAVTQPTNVVVSEITYQPSPSVYGIKLDVSWQGSEHLHEISYRKTAPTATNWTTISTSSNTFDIEGVTSGTWEIAVVAINFAGRRSAATVVNYNVQAEALAPSDVAGLALAGAWNAGPVRLVWNAVPLAARYSVEVWSNIGGTPTLRRTDTSATAAYQYTREMAILDGGPWRSLIFKVKAVSFGGVKSINYATVAASNAQVAALVGVNVVAGFLSIQVSYTQPSDADFAGVQVWVDTTANFTPSAANLVYDGADTTIFLQTLASGAKLNANTTYYLKIGAYDSFGKDSINASSSIAVTPVSVAGGISANDITETMIAAGAIGPGRLNVRKHLIS